MDAKKCAELYYLFKAHKDYDQTGYAGKYILQFGDKLRVMGFFEILVPYIIYLGFLLHILKIRFSESNMIVTMIVMNLLLSVPVLIQPFERFGNDYLAYIE